MLSYDPSGFFSKIKNQDFVFAIAYSMISYYDTLLSFSWNEEWQIKTYLEERRQYKFYDV